MATPLPDQKEFIDYLSRLAPEDETILLVRQKLKGSNTELYADGVLKATWVPYRPEQIGKIKDGWAIYGNTASFILDRMTDKVSASSANCEFVLVMVLDDIGTKSKVPPLEPTWKMETSEGSFQWGYTFSESPKKGSFAAAIRAIADAGYTDPGACNPVRNFRLPGSVNLKVDKKKFKSRLVEFHRDREFTLDEICKALGVTPGEDLGTGMEPTKIKRTDDEVLNWLSANGYVLSGVNSEGWCAVVCPNHKDHSDPSDVGARYNTNDRGFVCYHGHCGDWTSQMFLDWVAENGGPSVTHGIDDDAFVSTLLPALSKLHPDEKVLQAAVQGIAQIEEKQIGRVTKDNLFKRFAYLTSDDAYFDMETRKVYARNVFNATYRHLECFSKHGGGKIQASVFFDENRERKGALLLQGTLYAPGESDIVMKREGLYGNKWRDGRMAVDKTVKADIEPWLQHCRLLVSNPNELEHLFDMMAYKLQHPNVKINHGVLHAGVEGCGKDTFWAPFMWAVGGPHGDNHKTVSGKTINSQWGYHLESEILVINELRESSAAERHAMANDMKPLLAAPPELLEVNMKGLHPYHALNRMFVVAFSNSRSPISLSSQDRRWFVIWSEAPKMNPVVADVLWKWYKDGGFEAITAWLYQRDVSAFNPAAPPVETDYKQTLIEGGMSTSQAFLIHLIKEGIGEFQSGIVASPFYKLADRLEGQAPNGARIHHAGVIEALQEAGWHNLGQLVSKQYPNRKQVWVGKDIYARYMAGELKKSDIRNMAEHPAKITLLKKEQLC